MAEPPENDIPETDAHPARIRLGHGAQRRANATDLAATLGDRRLPGNTQVGDLVVLDAAGGREHFAVLRRTWVQEANGFVLEITLDWPARV